MSRDIIGRYEIRRRLGEGGMGVVYAAWDPLIGRDVALKLLRAGDTPESMQWALREARAAGALSHPNIVTIHDVGQHEDYVFIVMELVNGRDLAAAFESGSVALNDSSFMISVLRPVAEALDYAHARGVIHRDIKPANIFLRDDGSIKVGDFGIARIEKGGQKTHTRSFLGTPQYMAPELLQSSKATSQSDQYSLGVVAYQMITGRLPFSGESVIVDIVSGDVPRTGTPADAVLRKALAKTATQRYESCAAFVNALASAFLPSAAQPKPGTRRYVIPIAAAAAILLAAAVVIPNRDRPITSSSPATNTQPPLVETPKPVAEAPKVAPEPPKPAKQPASQPPKPAVEPTGTPSTISAGELTGTIVWYGKLAANDEVSISGAQPSTGQITRGLPGRPIDIRVTPRSLEILEAPSEANGWNRLRLRTGREIENIIITYQVRERG